MEKKRSTGVTIFGYAIYLFSILVICDNALFLIKSIVKQQSFNAWLLKTNTYIVNPDIVRLVTVSNIILAIIGVIIAKLVLALKEKGRKALIIYELVTIAISFLRAQFYRPKTLNHILAEVVVSIVIILYFIQPKVKEQFK